MLLLKSVFITYIPGAKRSSLPIFFLKNADKLSKFLGGLLHFEEKKNMVKSTKKRKERLKDKMVYRFLLNWTLWPSDAYMDGCELDSTKRPNILFFEEYGHLPFQK